MDWDVARQSQTIQTMLDDLKIEEIDDCENTVPFFNEEVTGPVFKKPLVWMKENRGMYERKEEKKKDELKKKKISTGTK